MQKENEVNLEIKIGSSFNYISDSTYKQIPMDIWRKLDSKKLLDKAIFDDQVNKKTKQNGNKVLHLVSYCAIMIID